MIDRGMAGDKDFLTVNATENGVLPVGLTPMEVVTETTISVLNGIKSAGEALVDDYPSAMQSAASAISESVSGCIDQGIGCVASDPREGYSGDRAFVDLLQGDKESAIGNNASAMAGELLPVATVVNQTGRVVGEVAEAMKNSVENSIPPLKPLVNIDTSSTNNIKMPDPEGDFSNINDPHNTKRMAENPGILRADEGHAQRNGTFVKDHNTPKNIQAAIDETLILPESLPERVIPESMNTVNNDNVDITFYENLKRSKEATKPLDEREGKSRFSAYEKMLDGLKNIKDGLEN
tara:strand:+ start:321 stop:1199 length:879 start_codon:yes stop_codon:yes gene_type:complete